MTFEMSGELKREVVEAAEEVGPPGDGGGERVDRAGRLHGVTPDQFK